MSGEIFEVYNHRNEHYYSFRALQFDKDFETYCRWMNQPYVAKWWGFDRSREELAKKLIAELEDKHQHLYIGMINGKPVSYWERYWVEQDILGTYISAKPFDQGLHFLIGESEYLGRTHTSSSIAAFSKLVFQDSRTQRIIGEPDVNNKQVLRYAEINCFKHKETVQMPERTSAIMVCERADFFKKFSAQPSRLYNPQTEKPLNAEALAVTSI